MNNITEERKRLESIIYYLLEEIRKDGGDIITPQENAKLLAMRRGGCGEHGKSYSITYSKDYIIPQLRDQCGDDFAAFINDSMNNPANSDLFPGPLPSTDFSMGGSRSGFSAVAWRECREKGIPEEAFVADKQQYINQVLANVKQIRLEPVRYMAKDVFLGRYVNTFTEGEIQKFFWYDYFVFIIWEDNSVIRATTLLASQWTEDYQVKILENMAEEILSAVSKAHEDGKTRLCSDMLREKYLSGYSES